MTRHPDHSDKIKNLNRIAGQVEGVRKMIGEGRYCGDILTQLRAIRAALRSLEAGVLETHMHHCVSDAILSGNKKRAAEKIAEVTDMFKRFDQ